MSPRDSARFSGWIPWDIAWERGATVWPVPSSHYKPLDSLPLPPVKKKTPILYHELLAPPAGAHVDRHSPERCSSHISAVHVALWAARVGVDRGHGEVTPICSGFPLALLRQHCYIGQLWSGNKPSPTGTTLRQLATQQCNTAVGSHCCETFIVSHRPMNKLTPPLPMC